MKPWKTWAGLAMLVMALTRCDFGTPPGMNGGGTDVEGVIVDDRGSPASGIWVGVFPDSVRLLGKRSVSTAIVRDSTTTAANGAFKFSHLPPGTYNLVSRSKRNDTALSLFRRSIVISAGTLLGTDTLRVSGGITIHILREDGSPVVGAQCHIPGSPFVTLSGLTGACTLEGVPPGIYRITVTGSGIPRGQSGEIRVRSREVTEGGKMVFHPPGWTVDTSDDDTANWNVILEPQRTFLIGDSGAADAAQAHLFNTLAEARMLISHSGPTGSLQARLTAPGNFGSSAGSAQVLHVSLGDLGNSVQWGASVRVYDSRGVLTHSDTASTSQGIQRIPAKHRRLSVAPPIPDSITATSGEKFGLRIDRIVVQKNGAPILDTTSPGNLGFTTRAFAVEYLNPAMAESLVISCYGRTTLDPGWNAAKPLYHGSLKLPAGAVVAPPLSFEWVGPSLESPIPGPVLVSPNEDALVENAGRFIWSRVAGATLYHVQVSTDSLFSVFQVNDSALTDTTRATQPLTENLTNYYWRVRARESSRVGLWSERRLFRGIREPAGVD